MIPQEHIEHIKERLDIVDIISDYIGLKQAGINFKGVCPFHSEKTPSFIVSREKQIFHCFGCSAGGNVYTFIMKFLNISFIEAVYKLAERAGVVIEEKEKTKEESQKENKKNLLYKLNQWAAQFYHENLLQGREAEKAREYFKKRGLSKNIIEKFKLGFAPHAWEVLKTELLRKKVSIGLLSEASLIAGSEKTYDYFRNRIIFPIFNIDSKIIGFGGRVLDSDSNPKYLNSRDSVIYNKSRSLYGIHVAKSVIAHKDCVYVVEGYFDVLGLVEKGIENVVAPLGTALTRDQVSVLKRYTHKIVLIFDSDSAGINAMKRSLKIFFDEGVEGRVLILPEGQDPDEFVQKVGKEDFLEYVNQKSQDQILFLLDSLISEHGKSVQAKSKILEVLQPLLADITQPMLKGLYLKEISERLSVDESLVFQFLGKEKRFTPKKQDVQPEEMTPLKFDQAQKYIVQAMLSEVKWIEFVQHADILDLLTHLELQEMTKHILDFYTETGQVDVSKIIQRTRYPSAMTQLSLETQELDFNEKILDDCCKKIRMRYMSMMQKDLLEQIKKEDNPKLLEQYQNLVIQQKKLKGGDS
ncbi:MAG: DNA primase [Deltaproteobacteria bacterium]|nr:DNA primase [Deltaproteobacteria bacterium]